MELCHFITRGCESQKGCLWPLKEIMNAATVSPTALDTKEHGAKMLVLPLMGAGFESKQWPCFA